MKILHTADWHIGHLLYEYDRTYEHQQFLDWLVETIREENIDVLLISGDVYDLSNPGSVSIKLFYTFLNKALKSNSNLQIVITAGNHDSASRLESPKPLLESSNIHIVGLIERHENGEINYEKLLIPLKNKEGKTQVWCLAIPFLRMGDYPLVPEATNVYVQGVSALYDEAFQYVSKRKQANQCIIAMGHLHTLNAEITEHDDKERPIMGGVEFVPSAAFHPDIKYVALGHIHKAQKIGQKEHIRYSGSPIPMSFSELNYKHQVIVMEANGENIENIRSLEIPLSITLMRIPGHHKPLIEVLAELEKIPKLDTLAPGLPPYLEVRVLLDSPEPSLRHKVETVLNGKHARLAKIDVAYPEKIQGSDAMNSINYQNLHEIKPLELLSRVYENKYGSMIPGSMRKLFSQAENEACLNEKEF